MDKNRIIIGLLIVSLLVNLVTLSFVLTGGQARTGRNLSVRQPQRLPKSGPGPSRSLEAVARQLGLDKEQKAKFQAEDKKIREVMERNWDKIQEASGQLKAELRKDAPDRAEIQACLAQIDQYHQQVRIARIDLLLDLRAMLPTAKKAKFDKLLKIGPRSPAPGPEVGGLDDSRVVRPSANGL